VLVRLRAELGDSLLLLFTSDHGEEFFEHDGVGHGETLYREVLRVPLLVEYPGDVPAARVAHPVSLLDVVPTVVELAELPADPLLPGRALPRADEPARTPPLRVAQHDRETYAVRLGPWKLVDPVGEADAAAGPELYDLARDAAERHDLASRHPERVRALRQALDGWRARYPALESSAEGLGEDALPAAVQDELRELGYLGGG
jgi:arylsulfatase A-like enzyme